MKTINKAITLLFLFVGVLTSCNSFTPQPEILTTTVMETSMALVKTEIVGTLTAVSTSTPTLLSPTLIPPTPTGIFPVPFDRHNPEPVLRAYFDAWDRNDWAAMASLERERAPEPVEFVHILVIKEISSSPSEYVYEVGFEIQVKGQGVSMHSGRYGWKYYLTWNPNRDTWFISNYGYG